MLIDHIGKELVRNAIDMIEFLRFELLQFDLIIGDERKLHGIEIGELIAGGVMLPISPIANERAILRLLIFHKPEGPGAHRMKNEIASIMLDRFVRIDKSKTNGWIKPKWREWLFERDDNGRIVRRLQSG